MRINTWINQESERGAEYIFSGPEKQKIFIIFLLKSPETRDFKTRLLQPARLQ